MILSMTGFGTGSSQRGALTVVVEARTVNHRFLDLHVHLGREYSFLEADIQQIVRSMIGRGRVDVGFTIRTAEPVEVLIDNNMAKGYLAAANRLRQELQISDTLDLKTLLTLPGVLQDKEAIGKAGGAADVLREAVISSLRSALGSVLDMRKLEGEALKADMVRYLASIAERNRSIKALLPMTVMEYRAKLEERMAQLLPQQGLDPQRLAQELAVIVDRSDISEEVARLESHIAQYRDLIDSVKEVGKKLDFLLQEMQREVNTILSKSGNLEITRLGIAIKADIEKLREQVQNIE